jgi:hypothetical protein
VTDNLMKDPGNPNLPQTDWGARLAGGVDELTKAVRQFNQDRLRRPDKLTSRGKVRFTVNVPENTTVWALGNGTGVAAGPTQGFRWEIRRLSVVDQTDPVANSDNVSFGLYCGTYATVPNAGAPTVVFDPTTCLYSVNHGQTSGSPVPFHDYWGGSQLEVNYGDSLFMEIVGTGSAAYNISAVVEYEQYSLWVYDAKQRVE